MPGRSPAVPTFRLFAAGARVSFAVAARPARRADRKPVHVQHRAFSGCEQRPLIVQPRTIKPSLDFTAELVAILAAKIRACVGCHARNKGQPIDHLTKPDQECWTRPTSVAHNLHGSVPENRPRLQCNCAGLIRSADLGAHDIPCELILCSGSLRLRRYSNQGD